MRHWTKIMAVFGLVAFAGVGTHAGAQTPTKKIRWVLAHEPVRLFKRAADKFAQEVKARTNGKVQVEVLTIPEYAKKYADGKELHQNDVIRMIAKDKIEMSQTYTTSLGAIDRDMYVLDLPFLFRDYDHAEKVLQGKIGDRLLARLERKDVMGLAFTYSGGYRIIPADKEIKTLAGFKGMKVRTSNSPVAQDTFTAIGAKPVPMDLDDVANATKQGKIEGAETTPSRYYDLKENEYSKVMNDTRHSLFLTSIIMSKKFWGELTADEQKAVRESAVVAARLERNESIADAEQIKKDCHRDGIPVVEMPVQMQQEFKAAVQPVYEKYRHYFSEDYVSEIRNN